MRKTILTSLTLLFAVTITSAQNSLSILNLDRGPWGSTEQSIIQSQGTVENTNGSTAIDVAVRRITIDTVPGTLNYFCWEQCYEPPTDVSPTSMTIVPGDRIDLFYADYKPQGNAGISTLAYCFYDVNNEADSVCATVRFSASPTGILDVFSENRSGVSESYPNPASDVANINYALHNGWNNASLNVYSMLGTEVKHLSLTENQGTVRLDVSSYPDGLYFYSLVVDGAEIQTRRMMVNH